MALARHHGQSLVGVGPVHARRSDRVQRGRAGRLRVDDRDGARVFDRDGAVGMVISERAYLILLAMLTGERVLELVLSRRNAARAFAHGAAEVGQGHFAAMAAFHALFIASCAAESIVAARAVMPAVSIAALAIAVAAQVLRYAAVVTLGERWNTRIIVMPEAAPVTRGIYRWVRHPNYVAVALELVAIPMIRGCWLTAAAFSAGNAALMAIRIPAEERALGRGYAQAFAAVPRFLPRLRS